MPDPDPEAYATGDRRILPATGDVHVQNRLTIGIGEQGANARDFVDVIQEVCHRCHRKGTGLFRSHHKPTPRIRASKDDQGTSSDGMDPCEFLDALVENFPVLQAQHEYSSGVCLTRLHACVPLHGWSGAGWSDRHGPVSEPLMRQCVVLYSNLLGMIHESPTMAAPRIPRQASRHGTTFNQGCPNNKMTKFNFPVLLLLSLGHMVVDVYQGALPAILPFIKERLDLSYTITGVILIVANVASSFVQPLFGYLSDKKEKAFLLPLGALLAGAGFALLPSTQNYFLILAMVALSGLGVAAYHPEGFKTARFFTGEKMATGMSVFSVGGNAGMALGPILALFIVNFHGFESISWMFLLSLSFTGLIILFRKAVAIPDLGRARDSEKRPLHLQGAARALSIIICVIIMRTWTHVGIMSYIPFYYINFLRGDPLEAGKLVSLFLLGGAFGTLAGAPLADRWGHRFWLRFSMIGSALLFPFIFLLEGVALMVLMAVLGMVLISTFTVTVVMGQDLLPGNLGVVSGLLVGFAIGVGGIGVTLLGVIADHYGVPFALKCIGGLPFLGFLFSLLLEYPLPARS